MNFRVAIVSLSLWLFAQSRAREKGLHVALLYYLVDE